MARAALCMGLLALAASPCLGDPTAGSEQPMEAPGQTMEWETAAAEAEKTAAETVQETMAAFEEAATTAHSVQEAVLDTVMKEVQSVFASTLAMPGVAGMEHAADTVKQVVDRVREQMALPAAPEAARTAAALRTVTTDLLKEIMVQEAVIETLWDVVRDTQLRPWITNEHQALQTTTLQAVTAYFSRMQDRMRYAGFTEEEITKLLPRSKTCAREGPLDTMEAPPSPERNMGKKRAYRGAYYPASYHYPSTYYHSSYPLYERSYSSYPTYYREPYYQDSGYGYGYGRGGLYRRMAERDAAEGPAPGPMMGPQDMPARGPTPTTPETAGVPPFPLTGFAPFARFLEEEGPAGPMEPMGPMDPEPAMGFEPPTPMTEGSETRNMGRRRGYSRGYYGYRAPYYAPVYYARPYYRTYSSYPSYSSGSYSSYPSYSSGSYSSYPSYSSGSYYGYPSYSSERYYSYPSYSSRYYGYPSYGYSRYPRYGYRYLRPVEVPDMEFEGPAPEPAPMGPMRGPQPTRGPVEPTPFQGSLRRAAAIVEGPFEEPEGPPEPFY